MHERPSSFGKCELRKTSLLLLDRGRGGTHDSNFFSGNERSRRQFVHDREERFDAIGVVDKFDG